MQIETTNIPALTLTIPADEARTLLADPTPLLDALRAKLAAQAAANGNHKNDIAFGNALRESAPKGKGKSKKPFLAQGTHKCPNCGRFFNSRTALNIHRTRMHDTRIVLPADEPSPE
jgi:hypothetical protein